MGHYALGSQRIVPIESARSITSEGIGSRLALRDRLRSCPDRARHPSPHRHPHDGRRPRSVGDAGRVERNDKALRAPVKGLLASPERPDGFFVNIHTKPGPYMVGDETIKIDGRSHVKEVVGGVSYLVSPTAFFQTNVGAAEILVKLVLDGIDDQAVARGSRSLLRQRAVLAADRESRRDGHRRSRRIARRLPTPKQTSG